MVRGLSLMGASVAIVAATGCSLPFAKAQAVKPRPTPSPSASPMVSPVVAPSLSPTSAPCKIAIAGSQPGSGGFVTVPGGEFVADSTSDVKIPTSAHGYGYAQGLSFDHAAAKWVPVRRAFVEPSGARYAFPSSDVDGGLYIVNARTGNVREIAKGSPYDMIEWRDPGIYAIRADSQVPYVSYHGLYRINPDSGAVQALTTRGRWSVIGPVAAWGYDVYDPNKPDASHTLLRLDLATGGVVAYLTTPGTSPSVIGFDEQDRPIVNVINDVAQQISILLGGNQVDQILSGPGYQSNEAFSFNGDAVTDSHGMWIGSNRGLMLFTYLDGLKKVSDATGRVAGGCH